MPALVAGIHDFFRDGSVQVVDARDKPGHDGLAFQHMPHPYPPLWRGEGDFDGPFLWDRLGLAQPSPVEA